MKPEILCRGLFIPNALLQLSLPALLLPMLICSEVFFEKNYGAWIGCGIVSVLAGVSVSRKIFHPNSMEKQLNLLDLIVFVYIITVLINSFFSPVLKPILKQEIILYSIPFYLWGKWTDSNGLLRLSTSVTVLLIFQLLFCFLQFLSIVSNANPYFKIAGTFGNPNVFAEFLALGIPFVFYLINKLSRFRYRLFFLILIIISVATIIFLRARGAILVTFVFGGWMFLSSIRKRKGIFVFLICSAFFFLVFCLCQFKTNSIIGRILIWEVSINAIMQTPFQGYGMNSFSTVYPIFQSQYLLMAEKEHLNYVAGDPFWGFNEIIEHAFEGGIGLAVIVFILLICPFYFIQKVRLDQNVQSFDRKIIIGVFLQFIMLSMINFTFTVFPFFMLFFVLLGYTSGQLNKGIYGGLIHKIFTVLSVLAVSVLLFFNALYLPDSIKIKSLSKEKSHTDQVCSDLMSISEKWPGYPALDFLTSVKLYREKRYQQSLIFLNRSILKCPSYQSFVLKSRIFYETGHVDIADFWAKKASYLRPSALEPIYLQFVIANSRGDSIMARQIAERILTCNFKSGSLSQDIYRRQIYLNLKHEKSKN